MRRLGRAGADSAPRPDESARLSHPPHDGHVARLPACLRFLLQEQLLGADVLRAAPDRRRGARAGDIDDHLVFFLDDNLLANRRHARALFDVLRGSGIVWQAAASLDVARDPRYLEEAYEPAAAACLSASSRFRRRTCAATTSR